MALPTLLSGPAGRGSGGRGGERGYAERGAALAIAQRTAGRKRTPLYCSGLGRLSRIPRLEPRWPASVRQRRSSGPRAGVRHRSRPPQRDAADAGRRGLRRPLRQPLRPPPVCPAPCHRQPAAAGAPRPGRRGCHTGFAARAVPAAGPARAPDRSGRHGRRRRARACLAGAACRRLGRRAGRAAAMGARRPARLLERLVLALESLAGGRPRVCRADAGPGAIHRLWPRIHPARLGRLGRRALSGPAGDQRRRAGPRRHRRPAQRCHGRLVRRLHGQLDRRAHRPLPRHRQPCQPLDPEPVRSDHRRLPLLAAGNRRADAAAPFAAPLRAGYPHAHADHPRRQGLPRANWRGPEPVGAARRAIRRRAGPHAAQIPLLPRREPLDSRPQNAKVWYQTVFAFLAEHVHGQAWQRPEALG